jgi:hypothetical protein
MERSEDTEILDRAANEQRVCITLDPFMRTWPLLGIRTSMPKGKQI